MKDLAYQCADDEALATIARLPQLCSLNLSSSQGLTDDGLLHLAESPRLETLDLSNTQITDVGLRYLDRLPHLKRLQFDDCDISDDGVEALARLGNLEELSLENCNSVTDTGLPFLAKMMRLRKLNLAGTRISRIAPLTQLPAIETLDLPPMLVNDAAIDDLAAMSSLRKLFIDDINDARLKRLRHLLPKCDCIRSTDLGPTQKATGGFGNMNGMGLNGMGMF